MLETERRGEEKKFCRRQSAEKEAKRTPSVDSTFLLSPARGGAGRCEWIYKQLTSIGNRKVEGAVMKAQMNKLYPGYCLVPAVCPPLSVHT